MWLQLVHRRRFVTFYLFSLLVVGFFLLCAFIAAPTAAEGSPSDEYEGSDSYPMEEPPSSTATPEPTETPVEQEGPPPQTTPSFEETPPPSSTPEPTATAGPDCVAVADSSRTEVETSVTRAGDPRTVTTTITFDSGYKWVEEMTVTEMTEYSTSNIYVMTEYERNSETCEYDKKFRWWWNESEHDQDPPPGQTEPYEHTFSGDYYDEEWDGTRWVRVYEWWTSVVDEKLHDPDGRRKKVSRFNFQGFSDGSRVGTGYEVDYEYINGANGQIQWVKQTIRRYNDDDETISVRILPYSPPIT